MPRLRFPAAAACAALALLFAPAAQAAVRGMDEAVNADLARQAGAPVRRPYLDLESLGEVWNLILLAGGGAAGFVIGRNWEHIWGRKRP